MFYCTNCGSPAADDQVFCTVCGQKLTLNPNQSGTPSSPAAESAAPGTTASYTAPPASQGVSYGAPSVSQNLSYTAPQPAPRYDYGPAETKTGSFNWERLQPRSGPAGAGALIFAVGILLAALFLMVWGTAFISPGGLGSDETLAAEATKKPSSSVKNETTAAGGKTSEAPTKAGTAALTEAPEESVTPGELPPSIAAKVNKSATRDAYYGSYSGTLTVDTYDLDKLAAASGAPAGQMDMYEAISGQTYAVTAEFQGNYVKVVSSEFPYTKPDETILEGPAKEEPENGCTSREQVMEADGYVLKNSEQVWFLSDGSIYLMNAITASKDGSFVGGMIIWSLLKPDK